MKLTPSLREELKKPLGALAKDASGIPRDAVVVSVGDTASDTLLAGGYSPKMVVYDGMTRRKGVGVSEAIAAYKAREHRVKNPPGHLEDAVLRLFRRLMRSEGASKVFVEGEEDLTALAAVKEAPLGAYVVYGQPGEGLVVVEVDADIKVKVGKMLKEMEDGN
jgi:GTP-dependent dephospho-CoA kinase